MGIRPRFNSKTNTHTMKLFLAASFVAFLAAPFSFAEDCKDKCDKEKCDKDKSTLVDNCDKCKKGDKDKKESTLADNCDKCKDGSKGDKKESTLA